MLIQVSWGRAWVLQQVTVAVSAPQARHCLALYESEATCSGIKFFNKLSLAIQTAKENLLKEN